MEVTDCSLLAASLLSVGLWCQPPYDQQVEPSTHFTSTLCTASLTLEAGHRTGQPLLEVRAGAASSQIHGARGSMKKRKEPAVSYTQLTRKVMCGYTEHTAMHAIGGCHQPLRTLCTCS